MTRIKIAKPGKDISSTDPRDFTFDSEFEAAMRLQDSGSGTTAIDGGVGSTTTVVIPHNLGYAPFFQVFLKWNGFSNEDYQPGTMYNADPDTASIEYIPIIDDTNLTLRFFNSAGVGGGLATVSYYYIIGRDPLV